MWNFLWQQGPYDVLWNENIYEKSLYLILLDSNYYVFIILRSTILYVNRYLYYRIFIWT